MKKERSFFFFFKVLAFHSLRIQIEIVNLAAVPTVEEQGHRSEAQALFWKLPTY